MERADPGRLVPAGAARPRALIVDDDPVGRIALRRLLAHCGYDALLATNGAEGVENFEAGRPDIVFMDMLMPVMDGLEAARHIKRLCGARFVPVIFVTGNSDDEDLVRCIDAGGDDFMVKPYSGTVLAAKIRAMERIRDLHRHSAALQFRMDEEQRLAKRILEGAVMGTNVRPPALQSHLAPASTFNGDLLLSAYSPSGDLYVLLGDFTGHGLAATIGALPAAETFRAMTAKGYGPGRILAEINRKLHALLPVGHFLAAAFARIDRDGGRVAVINCGMPDAWLLRDGAVGAVFRSSGLPLAVLPESDYESGEVGVVVMPGDHLVLVSDGALEATNAAGEMLGAGRLQAAFERGSRDGHALAAAVDEIERFCGQTAHADDVSLVDIHLVEALFADSAPEPAPRGTPAGAAEVRHCAAGWKISMELRGHALREAEPVPLLMSLLKEMPGVPTPSPELFTVLAELYNNGLDHGALQLDSRLKAGDFTAYLHRREARLAEPGNARVALHLDCDHGSGRPSLEIRVEDSGEGFDPDRLPAAAEDALHGRGIPLVRNLCDSLEYEGAGNRACAVYVWPTPKESTP